MSRYSAQISWHRAAAAFTDNRYSRGHVWRFDGGLEVPASSSPQVVPVPLSVEAALDPEEAFVAALASCHMLWFLSLAAKAGHVVESYQDDASGVMARNTEGKLAMTEVTLYPVVTVAAQAAPTEEQHAALHDEAHAQWHIANSARTRGHCRPTLVIAGA